MLLTVWAIDMQNWYTPTGLQLHASLFELKKKKKEKKRTTFIVLRCLLRPKQRNETNN